MQELDVTWGRAARIYWAIVWRAALLCGLSGLVIGFIFGFVFVLAGHREWIGTVWFGYLGMPVWIFIAVWMTRHVLRKKAFKEFRIALLPAQPGSTA